jgi:dynein heavy chain
VNITTPSDAQMKRIFGAILTAKLANFEDEPRMLGDALVSACVDVYNAVITELLPIPGKGHYVFNMRDLAKVTPVSIYLKYKAIYRWKVSCSEV